MALVFQILVLLIVLVGLITAIMSIKNWHWAQMLLLLAIFFSAIGTLVLGLETYRIHRNLRRGNTQLQVQIDQVNQEIAALKQGSRDAAVIQRIASHQENGLPFNQETEGRFPGRDVWARRAQDLERQRGRVWRGVQPGGPVDPATGRVPVKIVKPTPHGLEKDAIVYAFEEGEPNATDPVRGPQYLGEFRVMQTTPTGAVLEPVIKLDNPRTFGRLQQSTAAKPPRSWSLYETMPADSHELFAGLSKEDLLKILPKASVEEYIRQGSKATEDDDEYHRAGFDDQGRRLGPEDASKAVEWRYDRPLRDYAYLFSELAREKVLMLADVAALTEDVAKLKAADVNAKELTKTRTAQRAALQSDLGHMENDRRVIEGLLKTVQTQLANARNLTAEFLRQNTDFGRQLVARQSGAVQFDDEAASLAPGSLLLSPAP